MAKYPQMAAGRRVTAELLTDMQTDTVRKVSPETRENDSVFRDDAELTITLKPALYYEISGVLYYAAASEFDLKARCDVPSGGFIEYQMYNLPSSHSSNSPNGLVTYSQLWALRVAILGGAESGAADTKLAAIYNGLCWSGDGGQFKWQWAQNTAGSPPGSTLWSGSYINARIAFR